ncbi:MAG: segregation/condensation protein A [Rhodospirillales bacterium]|nr:segregation/condensation protein A [Rhodospirillales bacterium]
MATTEPVDSFEEQPAAEPDVGRFVIDIDGYEGPIDVLLTLARDQKVDLTKISILALAGQYLAFIAEARKVNLELAADYLVMAAWLAYLKSRLLLPATGAEDEPTAEESAAALALQLRHLEAMQEAGAKLMGRPRLGQDFYARGAVEEEPEDEGTPVYKLTLFELLKAYGDQRRRQTKTVFRINPTQLWSIEDALQRLHRMLGRSVDWQSLWQFLPETVGSGIVVRSMVAATLGASLELAKNGKIRLRQTSLYGPIYLQAVIDRPDSEPTPEGGTS